MLTFRIALVAALTAALVYLGAHVQAYAVHHPTFLVHLLLGNGQQLFAVAALGTGSLTLLDWAKRLDPEGRVPIIIELLSQVNELLTDMRWIEGNLPTGHLTTVRTGLPTVTWRLLNNGVAPSKSTTAQLQEGCGILEAWSEVDCDLAKLNGNIAAFRLSEARAFLEAMNQNMSSTVFYGNGGLTPEEFNGLAPRYNLSTAGNGKNIIKADGAGSDNASIWLVVWGDQTVHGIFPKGSQAGLTHQDFGEQTITVTTGIGGTRMRAYQERFQWQAGIAVKDWRYVVRICNIDISNLIAGGAFSADLLVLMAKAVHRIPMLGLGSPAFYCNRTIMEWLDIQARTSVTTGGQLKYEVVDGKPITSFRGIPIRRCDALLETEATVA